MYRNGKLELTSASGNNGKMLPIQNNVKVTQRSAMSQKISCATPVLKMTPNVDPSEGNQITSKNHPTWT